MYNVIEFIFIWEGKNLMPRKTIGKENTITRSISVLPNEWEQFQKYCSEYGIPASTRLRQLMQIDLLYKGKFFNDYPIRGQS